MKNKKIISLITIFVLTFSVVFMFGTSKANATASTKCLTCGGTTTKNYKVIETSRSYGKWKDANKPIINGGPSGGSKSFTVTQSFSVNISGDTGFDVASLASKVGFNLGFSKSFSETQLFKLKKKTKYKLIVRPNYLVQKVRFSVYSMGIGGSQKFVQYKYTTVKKPIGTEINIKVVK
ncbi:hypothetical protein [Bacillus sp. WP8]|nr:hypothetical protein [Bacillus sp. WP8]